MYERPRLSEVDPAPPTPALEEPSKKRPWVKPSMRPKQLLETLLLGLGYSLAVGVLLSLSLLLLGGPGAPELAAGEAPRSLLTAVLYQLAAYPIGTLMWAVATWALVVVGFIIRGWLRRYFEWLP